MKSSILSLLFLCWSGFLLSQEDSIPTFKLSKTKTQLFKGIDSEIEHWYFFVDEERFCYMANLELATEEIYSWFVSRKNSENIFKSLNETDFLSPIYLSKRNEPDVVLSFEMSLENDVISLISSIDDTVYKFQKINIQE